LTGKLPKLRELVAKEYSQYMMQDAQKAARHCRNTMHADLLAGQGEASLEVLKKLLVHKINQSF